MHNHDDKYPSRPVFEPGTARLQAPVDTNKDTNEPSGPANDLWWLVQSKQVTLSVASILGHRRRLWPNYKPTLV